MISTYGYGAPDLDGGLIGSFGYGVGTGVLPVPRRLKVQYWSSAGPEAQYWSNANPAAQKWSNAGPATQYWEDDES